MKRLALSLAALLTGCTSTGQTPLAADHPASPHAAEAAAPAVATALDASPPSSPAPAAGHDHAHDHAASASGDGSTEVKYACPHHPEVVSDKPGTCPKCGGMKLEPVTKPTTKPAAHAHDHAAPAPAASGSTEVKFACPHHPEVVSDKPGTCPKCGGMKLEPVTKPTTKPAGGSHDHAGHGGGQ